MKIIYSPQTRRTVLSYLALAPIESWALDCKKDAKSPTLKEGAEQVKLRLYTCKLSSSAEVTVQFNRVNELFAAALLSGKSKNLLPEVSENSKIVDNDVLREYRKIISEFGESDFLDFLVYITTSSPEGASQSSTSALEGEKSSYKMRTLDAGDRNLTVDYPEASALQSMVGPDTIPSGYAEISDKHIYRSMRKVDIDDYENNIAKYNELIARQRSWYPSIRFRTNGVSRHMRLLKYLTSSGLPSDFMHIVGYHDRGMACGTSKNSWQYHYYPRELLLEFAVVTNSSGGRVKLESILGSRAPNTQLRKLSGAAAGTDGTLDLFKSATELEPGHKLIVPTRIIFGIRQNFLDLFSDVSKPTPPAAPYAWGPEWRVEGLRVDGGTALLEGKAANYLAITTSCACGSCPYLAFWDEELRDWVNTGKILEDADSPEKSDDDWRVFSGVVLRFKLSEQEAELAYIRSVAVCLQLRSGEYIYAAPLSPVERSPFLLEFESHVELTFELPAGVRSQDVASSRFEVSGYYERYSDVLAGAALVV